MGANLVMRLILCDLWFALLPRSDVAGHDNNNKAWRVAVEAGRVVKSAAAADRMHAWPAGRLDGEAGKTL